jgi:hypothetical protein
VVVLVVMSRIIYFTRSGLLFSGFSISLFRRPTPLNVRLQPRDRRITTAVSGQQLGKHVPAAIDTNATIEGVFYVVCAEKL